MKQNETKKACNFPNPTMACSKSHLPHPIHDHQATSCIDNIGSAIEEPCFNFFFNNDFSLCQVKLAYRETRWETESDFNSSNSNTFSHYLQLSSMQQHTKNPKETQERRFKEEKYQVLSF